MPIKTLIPIVALLAILVLALASPASAAEAANYGPVRLTPLQIGQIFCLARVGNDMAPIEAMLTPSLRKAIGKAEALDAAYAKKHPGEKPPLGDGLPWQSAPVYTPNCSAAAAVGATDAEARVDITYAFDGAPSLTDTLLLRPVPHPEMGDQVWRLDDVLFGGKSGMRQEMLDAFKP